MPGAVPQFKPGAPPIGTYGTAPAGSTGPAGTIGGAGAYTPDWKALIEGDPGLLAARGLLDAGGVSDLAGRNAAIQNAYIQFGSNIDINQIAKQLGMSAADVQAALGADTQRLAQENTQAGLSTQARLDQSNQHAISQIRAALNKRGLLNSGEAGYQLDQENLGYRQAQSDATQKLLGYLQQYQQGYANAQLQRQQSLAQAYGDAADRQFQNNQGSAGTNATLDHIDAQGNPVYRGPDGTLYGSDGSIYVPPNQPASAAAAAAPQAAPAPSGGGVVNRPGGGGVVSPPSIFGNLLGQSPPAGTFGLPGRRVIPV